MAMEILSVLVTPFTEIAKCLFDPLKRQISYLKNYDENLGTLRDRVHRLVRRRNDIQKSIDEATQRRSEEPGEEVEGWLKDAGEVEQKMNCLEEDVKQSGNSRCFKGLCPDWSSRRRLSKRAAMMLRDVDQVQANDNFPAVLIRVGDPPRVVPRETTPSVEGLASREDVMEKVREKLRDENTRFIGLHGMGGIGKTTLVNKLNNELKESQLFEKVIFVTVSSSPDLKKIQDYIGSRLPLEFDPVSDLAERASRLLESLMQKKVLIILDDVWTRFELSSDIGIPSGSDHVGCKVILTTRNRDVCCRMGIETIFEVEPLSEEESWVLFTNKAGDVATQDSLLPIARKIAGKCKGSPLAIVVLGSYLKDMRNKCEWDNVLNALEYPDPIELEGIIPEVITSLKYSYDHLEGPDIKRCFLFFSMFPEDYDIPLSRMRDYGIGEGFLKVNKSLEDASSKLLNFVRKLKACGLLLDLDDDDDDNDDDDDDDKDEYVRMHDVVRDVAIHIASKDDNGFLIKAGQGLRSWPRVDILDTHKRISFMNNECKELPTPLESPQVRTLLLSQTWDMKINIVENFFENFFENLKALVVLDLSDCLVSMPKSLGHLTNLRTLYLEWCELSTNISILGELKNLVILRLSDSDIDRLPEEIGNLTNLRCLDLTDVRGLSNIAPNAISRLTKLEELHMLGSFEQWDMNGHASLAEVVSLPNLVSLKFKVRNGICAHQDIPTCSWKNLKEIKIFLKVEKGSNINLKGSGVHIHGTNKISNWVRILCQKASHLILSSCNGFKGFEDLDAVGCFSHLKRLHVQECPNVEYLLRIDEEASQVPFGILKKLIIKNMCNMKKILHEVPPATFFKHPSENDEGHIVVVQDPSTSRHRQLPNYETGAPKTFQNLRYFLIAECKILKNLFTFRLAQGLQQLQKLFISECGELKEIIVKEEDEKEEAAGHQGLLPSLKVLQLTDLPCLASICQHSLALGTFQSLERLDITDCHGLKNLFTFRLAQGLQQLQKLTIHGCDELKEIIAMEEDEKEEAAGHQGLLCSLKYLNLWNLPHLTGICQHSLALGTFQSLEDLDITDCHGLNNLFTFRLAQGFQQLQKLSISTCGELKEIIAIEADEKKEAAGHQGLLPSLEDLQLKYLPCLTGICQGGLLLYCSLKSVIVTGCPNLKRLPLELQGLSNLVEISVDFTWSSELGLKRYPHPSDETNPKVARTALSAIPTCNWLTLVLDHDIISESENVYALNQPGEVASIEDLEATENCTEAYLDQLEQTLEVSIIENDELETGDLDLTLRL